VPACDPVRVGIRYERKEAEPALTKPHIRNIRHPQHTGA
jgi:hypothetical protein